MVFFSQNVSVALRLLYAILTRAVFFKSLLFLPITPEAFCYWGIPPMRLITSSHKIDITVTSIWVSFFLSALATDSSVQGFAAGFFLSHSILIFILNPSHKCFPLFLQCGMVMDCRMEIRSCLCLWPQVQSQRISTRTCFSPIGTSNPMLISHTQRWTPPSSGVFVCCHTNLWTHGIWAHTNGIDRFEKETFLIKIYNFSRIKIFALARAFWRL